MARKYKSDPAEDAKAVWICILFFFIVGVLIQIYNGIIYVKDNHPVLFYAAVAFSIVAISGGAYFKIKKLLNAPATDTRNPVAKVRIFDENRYDKQLKSIAEVECMTPKRILGKEESISFYAAKNAIKERRDFHLHAQVSMGEIIKCHDINNRKFKDAFRSINSKRVDMLICDNFGNPVLAIEYQGGGHNIGKDSAKRNAVKQLALRKAGITLLETYPGQTIEGIELMIKERIDLLNLSNNH